MKLRNFTDGNSLGKCFFYPTSPMIKISKTEGITYHHSMNDKIATLKARKRSDKFMIAWPGQWSTDVFEITNFDIGVVLEGTK
jgi:hypothetical protein